jgi:hypothetical protein
MLRQFGAVLSPSRTDPVLAVAILFQSKLLTSTRPETDIRNRQSPLEHAASQLIGKARIAETLGEGGEVLLPTKQISQIGSAQVGIR